MDSAWDWITMLAVWATLVVFWFMLFSGRLNGNPGPPGPAGPQGPAGRDGEWDETEYERITTALNDLNARLNHIENTYISSENPNE